MHLLVALLACFRCFRIVSRNQEGFWSAYPEMREVLWSILVGLYIVPVAAADLVSGRGVLERLQGSAQQLLWDLLRC